MNVLHFRYFSLNKLRIFPLTEYSTQYQYAKPSWTIL